MLQEDPAIYWNQISEEYQQINRISVSDFHYGPLLAGDKDFQLIPNIKGKRALELGCGGAQNSLYLASLGAQCTAVDISKEQLQYAQKLSNQLNLPIELVLSSLDEFDFNKYEPFDLIHSTWSFPFSHNQERLIQLCSKALKPNGTLLITTGHPVFAGEWIILDEYEQGMFLPNYFQPPSDTRFTKDEENFIQAEKIPIGKFTSWLLDANLQLTALVEPQPLPIHEMTEKEIEKQVPYDAQPWRELYEQIINVPFVVIYKAVKNK